MLSLLIIYENDNITPRINPIMSIQVLFQHTLSSTSSIPRDVASYTKNTFPTQPWRVTFTAASISFLKKTKKTPSLTSIIPHKMPTRSKHPLCCLLCSASDMFHLQRSQRCGGESASFLASKVRLNWTAVWLRLLFSRNWHILVALPGLLPRISSSNWWSIEGNCQRLHIFKVRRAIKLHGGRVTRRGTAIVLC